MQATISAQRQPTTETVEIIVCRSLLAALTSSESLCGVLTELFEVSVSVEEQHKRALHASSHLHRIPQSTHTC